MVPVVVSRICARVNFGARAGVFAFRRVTGTRHGMWDVDVDVIVAIVCAQPREGVWTRGGFRL